MKPYGTVAVALAVLVLAGICFAQSSPALCPRHIESPTYPQIARIAHITGAVVLRVTIGADGSITQAAVKSKPNKILDQSATENLRHWTFTKPLSAPYVETITYVYSLDESLPPSGGSSNAPVIVNASFDLPDRVNIRANVTTIEP